MRRILVFASILIAVSLGVLSSDSLDDRIIGGQYTSIEKYPYQLALEYFGLIKCGAVIISGDWALTAAHCVYRSYIVVLALRAGTSYKESGGTLHTLSEIVIHPDYDNVTINFDIAALKVSTPFTYGRRIQPIPLAKTEPATGEVVSVTGWGVTSFQGRESHRLKVVFLKIIDHELCNEDYMELYNGITEFMICAGLDEGGEDACTWDSGGPMVVNGELAGIISWGEKCAYPEYPGVYTNVARLRDFVFSVTGVK